MIDCPVGTYNPNTGMGDLTTECLPCEAGYYCLIGESSVTGTGPCEPGFYCPTGITNEYGDDPPLIGSYGAQHVCYLS